MIKVRVHTVIPAEHSTARNRRNLSFVRYFETRNFGNNLKWFRSVDNNAIIRYWSRRNWQGGKQRERDCRTFKKGLWRSFSSTFSLPIIVPDEIANSLVVAMACPDESTFESPARWSGQRAAWPSSLSIKSYKLCISISVCHRRLYVILTVDNTGSYLPDGNGAKKPKTRTVVLGNSK